MTTLSTFNTPASVPEALIDRCTVEPYNGYDEEDGVWLVITRSDDPNRVDTEGHFPSYDEAMEWAVKAYRRGELTV